MDSSPIVGTDWLTVFKFAGILVSGALGIIGTLTETHVEVKLDSEKGADKPKTVKRLNTWGRCAAVLTILGFVVAFGSQLVESTKEKQKARAEQEAERKKTQEQMEQANAVLERLEAQGIQSRTILSNVQKQSVQAGDILDGVHKQGELVAQSLQHLSVQSTQTTRILQNLGEQNALSQKALGSLERIITRFDYIAAEQIMMLLPATNSLVEALADQLYDVVKGRSPGDLGLLDKGLVSSRISGVTKNVLFVFEIGKYWKRPQGYGELKGIDSLLDALSHPELVINVKRANSTAKTSSVFFESKDSDLFAIAGLKSSEKTFLHFALPSRRIFIRWEDLVLPEEVWQVNGKIIGTADLPGAQFQLMVRSSGFKDMVDKVFADATPQWVHFVFDKLRFSLHECRTVSVYREGKVVEAILPEADVLLTGAAYKPRAWPD